MEGQLFHKILLPIDLLCEPEKVLSTGISISEWSRAQLIILHAYRLILNPPQGVPEKEADIKKYLESQADHLFKSLEQQTLSKSLIPYQFFSEVGFMADRIIANAKNHEVDLVILHDSVAKRINDKTQNGYEKLKLNIDCPIMLT